jgi:hypothetical protein
VVKGVFRDFEWELGQKLAQGGFVAGGFSWGAQGGEVAGSWGHG